MTFQRVRTSADVHVTSNQKSKTQMFVLVGTLLVAALPLPPLRVAIVGAGIAGGATSYYIQELLSNASRPAAEIVAFDSSVYIGGRLKHTLFETSNGEKVGVELGGAAWADGNQYVRGLAAALGINTTLSERRSRTPPLYTNCSAPLCAVGVWDGADFAHIAEVALRNAGGLVRVAAVEAEFLADVKRNYVASAAAPFTTLHQFLSLGNLSAYTSTSIRSFFTARGVKEELIATGMGPLTRAIYNRDCDANAFALLASLTAALSQHSVIGGNYKLVEALFAHAAAETRLNTTVHRIHFDAAPAAGSRPFVVTSINASSGDEVSDRFDKVVIAAPLERTNITFSGWTLPAGAALDRGFTDWHVTVLEAHSLAPSQFGAPLPLPLAKRSGGGGGGALLPHPRRAGAPVDLSNCDVLTTANGTTPRTPYVCVQPLGKHGGGDSAKSVCVLNVPPLHCCIVCESCSLSQFDLLPSTSLPHTYVASPPQCKGPCGSSTPTRRSTTLSSRRSSLDSMAAQRSVSTGRTRSPSSVPSPEISRISVISERGGGNPSSSPSFFTRTESSTLTRWRVSRRRWRYLS